MPQPICVPCKVEMVCDKNEAYVHDPPSGQFPATYWSGDRYRCPKCGHQIIAGIASKGVMVDDLRPEDAEEALEFTYR